MTEEKLTEITFEISTSLAGLNENMKAVLDKLTQHEGRITTLEQYHPKQTTTQTESSLKDDMIRLLCKTLLIGSVSIAFLAGAGSVISKIFGV